MDILARALLLAVLALPASARDFAEFGGRCDGVTDDRPAWDAAMAAIARPAHDRVLSMPAGGCMFYSPPAPIPESASVLGQGLNATVLRRAYSRGLFIVLQGLGSRLHDVALLAEPGTYGGTALYAESTDAAIGGAYNVRNVWIAGPGMWSAPVQFDGSARTVPPLGVRDVVFENVYVFNASWWLASCWSCVAFEWRGGGAFQGAGPVKGIAIGGPNSAVNRIDIIYDAASSAIWPGVLR